MRTIREIEYELSELSFERIYIFNQQGKIIYRKSGTLTEVDTSDLNDIREEIIDSTMIHSHPWDFAFSPSDLLSAFLANAKEARVVHRGIIYFMNRGQKGWPVLDIFDHVLGAWMPRLREPESTETRAQWCRDLANKYKGHMQFGVTKIWEV